MSMCGQVHMMSGALRGQKVSGSLELMLQVTVSCLVWMPGTEPGSLTGAASALNQRALFLALLFLVLY